MISNPILAHLALVGALLALPAVAAPAMAESYYARGALGYDTTLDTRFRDRDCRNQAPPALFGCQTGSDGRAIGSRGDFGSGISHELAAGYRHSPWLRIELAATQQTGFDFDGEANFLGVSESQPARGRVRSSQAMVLGLVDLPTPALPFSLQPFVGAGLGWSRNSTGTFRYHFPGLGENASTLVRGGSSHEFAWQLRAGLAAPLTPRLAAELVLVYSDLGKVETGRGDATIRRPSGDRSLAIDATEATLRSRAVRLGLRYSF
ncbi:MAG: outer membrane beta-barrel protein [Bacteroidales bacterium]|nr:outer membrane beta-barrel protein [Bacteroidales bacterium]